MLQKNRLNIKSLRENPTMKPSETSEKQVGFIVFFYGGKQMGQAILTKEELYIQYVELGKSDREIAKELGVNRTTITHLRHKYQIPARKSIGTIGELLVKNELEKRGYEIEYLKEKCGISPYDFLVNGKIRIQTLSAVFKGKKAYFALTDKKEINCKESDIRIRLRNGRTRKIFRKTCDFLVFVVLENEKPHYWIIPSDIIEDHVQGISLNPYSKRAKYDIYKNAWNLILSSVFNEETN
jgi:Homeodomain-like domain